MRRIRRRDFANVGFGEFCRVVEAHGFTLARVSGSHHIYRHPEAGRDLNLQPDSAGDAKPYQVRQFLQMVERYNLSMRPTDE